ncbi:MAG TPA: SBBP repeat-containing protein [Pirellulales bacterium]|nr:SBBP repeat-containing protein [Pirellulales bacterium]
MRFPDWLKSTSAPFYSGKARRKKLHRNEGGRRQRTLSVANHFEQLEERWLLAIDTTGSGAALTAANPATTAQVQQEYGQLPLTFEANQGQTNSQVDFLTRGPGYSMFLTGTGVVIDLQQAASPPAAGNDPTTARTVPADVSATAIRMQFIGASASASVMGLEKQQTQSNYFIGNDPSQWHTGVANFGQVEYENLYSGINAVFYGNQRQLEYDFDVAPGANPGQIEWQIQGATGLNIDSSGSLLIHTSHGDLTEKAPTIYQEVDGSRAAVAGRFVLEGSDRVGFVVGSYNTSLPLIIDPTLEYSTYLGGSSSLGGDVGFGIAVDGAGNAYVTGWTSSSNFPTTAGAYQTTFGGWYNAFVTKLSADGHSLIYSTYLGGSVGDEGLGIAVDGSGNACITGYTYSLDFPTTTGAYQTTFGGTATDAFVTKLSADGRSLVYSTYLGGRGDDEGCGIAVDRSGNAYVTGYTGSANFPTTSGAYQTTLRGYSDVFSTKLSADGRSLAYSTYLGSSDYNRGLGIAVDGSGHAYVTGIASSGFPTTTGAYQTTFGGKYYPVTYDAFVTKLSADGRSLVYSTYLGGDEYDGGFGIAVDGSGNAYVTGVTGSTNFPATAGAYQTTIGGYYPMSSTGYDAFVAKLSADGRSLVYSTYLGGGDEDFGSGITVDGSGNAYVSGITQSSDFPTTTGAYQTTFGGVADAFVTRLSADGDRLTYSTYLGGKDYDSGSGIAIDGSGDAYVVGFTASSNFPTTTGAYQTKYAGERDAFVSKLVLAALPPPVVNVVDVEVAWGSQTMSILNLGRDLPFINIKAIDVIFSDDVQVNESDLVLTGINVSTYSFSGFSYNKLLHEAVWTLASPLGADRLQMTIDGLKKLGFSVLPGDFTGDGVVAAQDAVDVLNLTAQGAAYSVWADVDGSGVVDLQDYLAVRSRIRAHLP